MKANSFTCRIQWKLIYTGTNASSVQCLYFRKKSNFHEDQID